MTVIDPTNEPAITLADDPTHGGVSAEALEAAAQASFSNATKKRSDDDEPIVIPSEGDGDAGDTGEGEGDGGREGVPSAPSPEPDEPVEVPPVVPADGNPPVLEGTVEIAGVRVPVAELEQWVEFGNFLRANPEYAQRVEAALTQEVEAAAPAPPTAPAAASPPEGVDLDDPAIAALWNQHLATLATIERLEANVQHLDSYVTNAQAETTQSLLNTARATYQSAHNLTDTEMQTVYDVAGRLQVLPALLAPVDPVTGAARTVDPLAAMQEAFELARWNIPELREREMQMKADEQKSDTKRKQKLSSLGGSSGSVPRTTQAPRNAQERRQAMIEEVAAMINGEGAS